MLCARLPIKKNYYGRYIFKEIGLKDEKIKIHSDSVSLLDNPTNTEIEDEKAERTVKYGGKLLGAYIGSNEFVRENLQKKLHIWNVITLL